MTSENLRTPFGKLPDEDYAARPLAVSDILRPRQKKRQKEKGKRQK
jgi:hypothetical protein